MNASKTSAKLTEPRIYQAMNFAPATPEGLRPYSLHLVAAFDHADAVTRLRAAGLIGADTYVLTDEDRRVERNTASFVNEWSFGAPTVQEQLGWIEVMLYEVHEDGKLLRGPSWVRVAP